MDIILIKNIKCFGKDSVEILDGVNQLKQLNTRIVFRQEELDTEKVDSDLLLKQLYRLKMNSTVKT